MVENRSTDRLIPRERAKAGPMKLVVTSEQMAEIDRVAQTDYGIPGMVLMEHAGLELYRLLLRLAFDAETGSTSGNDAETGSTSGNDAEARPPSANGADRTVAKPRLVIVCGRGNNGGDGLVIARLATIAGTFGVTVVDAGCGRASKESLTGVHLASCRALGVPVHEEAREVLLSLDRDDWIVDAVSGTGLKGALRAPAGDIVDLINSVREQRGPRVFSVDVPSGLGDEYRRGYPVVFADVTATVGRNKRCLFTPAGRTAAGDLYLLNIFFPRQVMQHIAGGTQSEVTGLIEQSDVAHLLPPVSLTAHKGERGHVVVFAGKPGTTGAALLCATAATRARVGLVSMLVDPSVAERIDGVNPALMVNATETPEQELERMQRRVDAVLIGPGWGTDARRRATLTTVIDRAHRGIIDADGLTVLSSVDTDIGSRLSSGEWVLTPHPGECARLSGCDTDDVLAAPDRVAKEVARKYGAVVLLKAASSWICAPDGRLRVIDGAHRSGGVGGSGDVLSGIVAALLAGGADAFSAACAAAGIHAAAIRRAYTDAGWFSAIELPDAVGHVLAALERMADRYG